MDLDSMFTVSGNTSVYFVRVYEGLLKVRNHQDRHPLDPQSLYIKEKLSIQPTDRIGPKYLFASSVRILYGGTTCEWYSVA